MQQSLSTLLLPYNVKTNKIFLSENLESFKIAILSQSLSWPKDFINKVFDVHSYIMINHISKKDQAVSNTYHADWAERILEKWKSIDNSL